MINFLQLRSYLEPTEEAQEHDEVLSEKNDQENTVNNVARSLIEYASIEASTKRRFSNLLCDSAFFNDGLSYAHDRDFPTEENKQSYFLFHT